MFVCDQSSTYFDVKSTLGMRSYQIWNKACTVKSLPKHPLCMIIAEAKTKTKNPETKQNNTKYEFKHLIDGTHWFWSGTHCFLWGESQGLIYSTL